MLSNVVVPEDLMVHTDTNLWLLKFASLYCCLNVSKRHALDYMVKPEQQKGNDEQTTKVKNIYLVSTSMSNSYTTAVRAYIAT